ncbi:hypothetical protein [Ignatzschineria indica]
MGEKAPLRIDFFDNEIDSIRTSIQKWRYY